LNLFYTSVLPPIPISTLFPYTTLFRSSFFSSCTVSSICPLPSFIIFYHVFHLNFHKAADDLCILDFSAYKFPVRRKSWTDALCPDRKSTRLNSSHVSISYAVFCLKKKT